MKRVLLFLATNLAVVLVLSIVLNLLSGVLGINRQGMGGLLLMAAVFGFGESYFTLDIQMGGQAQLWRTSHRAAA